MQEALEPKEDKIFRIIDSVLKRIFGEKATVLIYEHLDHKFALSQSEFSQKLDVFAKGLEDFLSSGAFAVENRILNAIHSSYNIESTRFQMAVLDEHDFASLMRIAIQNA